MKEWYSQRVNFGDFTQGDKRSQRTERTGETGHYQAPYITEEQREAWRQQREADGKRYKELLFAHNTRPFSEDEWRFLESSFFQPDDMLPKLHLNEKLQYEDKVKGLRQAMRERATEYLKEALRDRYPSWWEVYDENGKRIWKMSPQHKASLARMRQFESLSPDEKYEVLKQTFPNLFTAKGESPGEKFAMVIDGIFAFLLSLFQSPADNDQPVCRPA